MGKHYCRKGGAPVGVMDVPPFADPGRVVESTDRLEWEEPTYGRVRMLFRCCATVLVEFMASPDDTECADTYTRALPLDQVARVPEGVAYQVPCVGAEWSATLECGHVNGEGCDCGTIAVEAADQDADDGHTCMDDGGAPVDCYGCTRDDAAHTCGPGIDYGCGAPGCGGDTGD